MYGLAVALDRDGSGDQAIRRILAQGADGFDAFNKEYTSGSVFFVPAGESNYYFALVNEAFGNYGDRARVSGTRTSRAARTPSSSPARASTSTLLHKKHVRAEPTPPPEPDDLN